MVKPRNKSKASKRMSGSLKTRINKIVASHNKKQNKQAKKNGGKMKKFRKDPGVPNSAPFKQQVMKDAAVHKQKAEAERLKKKQGQSSGINSLLSIQENALKRQKEFEEKEMMMQKFAKNNTISMLSKETSMKAYGREFNKVVETSDVVIEVLDARDPLGCRCKQVEKAVFNNNATKRVVLLLNKIDLVPKENVEAWIKYLSDEYPTVAFKASTQTQKDRLTQCKVPVKHLKSLSNTAQCVGADALLKLLSNYCRVGDQQTSIVVGVVGYPNVGKSSVINSLKRAKACGVGSTPGFTKNIKEVVITKNIKILDSPGIVMAKGNGDNEASVILRNCVKVEDLADPKPAVEAIIKRCNNEQLMQKYSIENFNDVDQFLSMVAKRYGKLERGGQLNLDEAAKQVLNDWNSGKISYYTHPPQRKTVTTGAKIVTNLLPEFDWKSLNEGNKQSIQSVQSGEGMMETDQSQAVRVEMPSEEQDDKMDDSMDVEQDMGMIEVSIPQKKMFKEEKQVKSTFKVNMADPSSGVQLTGSNVTANHNLKQALKMKRKKQNRADKIGNALGDSLEAAFATFEAGSSKNYDQDVNMD